MAKKSNLELYKYFQMLIDKSETPHQPPRDFVRNYEASRLEWMKLKGKDFEVTELRRSDLRAFIRFKGFGSTKRANLSELERHILIVAVHGDYSFGCNGKVNQRTLPIAPRGIDYLTILTDPFNIPADTDPVYIEQNDGEIYLDILSPSTPQNLTVHYLKYPEEYRLAEDPNGFTEEEELQQNEIVLLAVKNYTAEIENYNRAQVATQQVQQTGT